MKFEREKRNWSQKFVAGKVGITNTVLSNYERDYRDPDTDTLKKLADLYEVGADYLLGSNKPSNQTSKDERDIAKRLDQIRNDLEHADGLAFDGEPLSDEAKESFMEAMEFVVRQTKKINKKYIPKKYRKGESDE
ncbi:transcriptional regulator with XRE-family HTH domain [Bacillus benzoevorans]|uniref:Transcriptional regulator with XRE-family HTH domain n=1 Tax=Bacillus benzoevorans TaxID=1456 RepID=A0A7X0HTD7_9BACI|nr:transcriptional regulator with XRE-family HTH domain [Bacillus benzoevorans]